MRRSGWDARIAIFSVFDNYFTRLIYFAIGSRHTPQVSADSGNFGSRRIACFRAWDRIPGLSSQIAPPFTLGLFGPPSPQLLNVLAMNTSCGIFLEQLMSKRMRIFASMLFILNF
jgi:hypothetical protein